MKRIFYRCHMILIDPDQRIVYRDWVSGPIFNSLMGKFPFNIYCTVTR